MYPRAEAYIISVKQSTYCQFGEVIRVHAGRREKERERQGRRKDKKGLKGQNIETKEERELKVYMLDYAIDMAKRTKYEREAANALFFTWAACNLSESLDLCPWSVPPRSCPVNHTEPASHSQPC